MRMRQYELMLVLAPTFDISDTKKRDELIKTLLKDQKGTVVDVKDFGKKPLAYPIAGNKEGVFIRVTLESDALQVSGIEKQMKIQSDIMRFLLLKKTVKKSKVGKKVKPEKKGKEEG